MKRYYGESDINGLYMGLRHKAMQSDDKKIDIKEVFEAFENFKKNNVRRLD